MRCLNSLRFNGISNYVQVIVCTSGRVYVYLVYRLGPLVRHQVHVQYAYVMRPSPTFVLVGRFFRLLRSHRVGTFFEGSGFCNAYYITSISNVRRGSFVVSVIQVGGVGMGTSLFRPIFRFVRLVRLGYSRTLFLVLVVDRKYCVVATSLSNVLLGVVIRTTHGFSVGNLHRVVVFGFCVFF